MKYFLILVLSFSLSFFACQGQNYKIEKQASECLISFFKMKGIDIMKELSFFENHLIEHGILKDNSGESYYDIYKQIERENYAVFSINYSFFDTIRLFGLEEIQTNDFNCFDKKILNGRSYKKSKLYALSLAFDSIAKATTADALSPNNIAKIITRILSPKDFEQDYYKITLMLVLSTIQQNKNVVEYSKEPFFVPKKPAIMINKRNFLHLRITTDMDSLYFNDYKIRINDSLAIAIKEFILNEKSDPLKPELKLIHIEKIGDCYQSKCIVQITTYNDSYYKTLVNVQNQTFKAFNLIKNEMSLKYFKKEYDNLNDSEKKAIEELVPFSVTFYNDERNYLNTPQ